MYICTVYLQGSRRLRFADAVLWHAGVGALIFSSHLGQTQTILTADFKSGEKVNASVTFMFWNLQNMVWMNMTLSGSVNVWVLSLLEQYILVVFMFLKKNMAV